ncbi:unnamed protein product, partial [Laminaria digitata]
MELSLRCNYGGIATAVRLLEVPDSIAVQPPKLRRRQEDVGPQHISRGAVKIRMDSIAVELRLRRKTSCAAIAVETRLRWTCDCGGIVVAVQLRWNCDCGAMLEVLDNIAVQPPKVRRRQVDVDPQHISRGALKFRRDFDCGGIDIAMELRMRKCACGGTALAVKLSLLRCNYGGIETAVVFKLRWNCDCEGILICGAITALLFTASTFVSSPPSPVPRPPVVVVFFCCRQKRNVIQLYTALFFTAFTFMCSPSPPP